VCQPGCIVLQRRRCCRTTSVVREGSGGADAPLLPPWTGRLEYHADVLSLRALDPAVTPTVHQHMPLSDEKKSKNVMCMG